MFPIQVVQSDRCVNCLLAIWHLARLRLGLLACQHRPPCHREDAPRLAKVRIVGSAGDSSAEQVAGRQSGIAALAACTYCLRPKTGFLSGAPDCARRAIARWHILGHSPHEIEPRHEGCHPRAWAQGRGTRTSRRGIDLLAIAGSVAVRLRATDVGAVARSARKPASWAAQLAFAQRSEAHRAHDAVGAPVRPRR